VIPEAERAHGQVPSVSVIVPCYKDAEGLEDLMDSLERQSSKAEHTDFEVIVVDSGADERVVATAEGFSARCIRGGERLLPGEARNLGAQHARGAWLAFIDADCVAEPDWVLAVADGLRAGGVLIGGPVLDRHPWYTVASVDNLLQFADYGADRAAGPIRHVPSCNMAMRREDFLAVGGFEHRGQRSGEDVLLTEAANERWPGRLTFVPGMRVGHRGRREFGAMLSHQHDFGYARGALGLHLSASQRRWGRRAALLPAVVLKRLAYVCGRGVRHGRISWSALVLIMPMVLLGLVAWAIGFRRGLRVAAE
jgi:glycosyltransferase involved in cell wall biosynthesis